MLIRPATLADCQNFYGKNPPMTLRALAAERDGEVVGIGGYYISDEIAHAFTDQKGMTRREIAKAGRAMMKFLDAVKIPVVAQCGPDGDTALKHYGFEPFDTFWRRA